MGFFKAFLCFFALLIFLPFLSASSTVKQTYIVHMKHQDKPFPYATHHDWYSAQLRSLFDSDFSLLYTYTDAFYVFAAKLDPDQAEALRRSDLVLGVYEDTLYPLHTTCTPEFLSQNTQLLEQASHDVIIGVLDTSIWPESKSFDDSDLPEIPTHWRGECEPGPDFRPTGGRLLKKAMSPRDQDGHGTHFCFF